MVQSKFDIIFGGGDGDGVMDRNGTEEGAR